MKSGGLALSNVNDFVEPGTDSLACRYAPYYLWATLCRRHGLWEGRCAFGVSGVRALMQRLLSQDEVCFRRHSYRLMQQFRTHIVPVVSRQATLNAAPLVGHFLVVVSMPLHHGLGHAVAK